MCRNDYTSRTPQLLHDFDKAAPWLKQALQRRYGEQTAQGVIASSRGVFETLIGQMPYIGQKNLWMDSLSSGTRTVALHRVLEQNGGTAEETGQVVYEAAELQSQTHSKLVRRQFDKWGRMLREYAVQSQQRRYPGDWVIEFIEGDAVAFDFGFDVRECALCKFFQAQGVETLTRFLCPIDYPVSKAYGTGLVRTTTLAEGGERCDFRWKMGRHVRWG